MKLKSQLTLVLLALATGCASNHEIIPFSDEADVRAQLATPTPVGAAKHLGSTDEIQIEQLVFGYLLENHLWTLDDCPAIFIQADESEVAELIKKYPHHVPTLKPAKQAVLKSDRPPVDKDTRKPAILLTVEVNQPNPDDSVDATGRWYAGNAVTGSHAIHLKKVDGTWQISEKK